MKKTYFNFVLSFNNVVTFLYIESTTIKFKFVLLNKFFFQPLGIIFTLFMLLHQLNTE